MENEEITKQEPVNLPPVDTEPTTWQKINFTMGLMGIAIFALFVIVFLLILIFL